MSTGFCLAFIQKWESSGIQRKHCFFNEAFVFLTQVSLVNYEHQWQSTYLNHEIKAFVFLCEKSHSNVIVVFLISGPDYTSF